MYLLENNNKQIESNEQVITNELNQNIIKEIKEENKIEELSSEQNNKINSGEAKNAENKEETNVNKKNDQNIINITNNNLNLNEIIIENDKSKNINHEKVPECINNCINWTLRAHINKKNNQKDYKNNFNFQGKNLFIIKFEYSILNAMNNSWCFENFFKKIIILKIKKKYSKN